MLNYIKKDIEFITDVNNCCIDDLKSYLSFNNNIILYKEILQEFLTLHEELKDDIIESYKKYIEKIKKKNIFYSLIEKIKVFFYIFTNIFFIFPLITLLYIIILIFYEPLYLGIIIYIPIRLLIFNIFFIIYIIFHFLFGICKRTCPR